MNYSDFTLGYVVTPNNNGKTELIIVLHIWLGLLGVIIDMEMVNNMILIIIWQLQFRIKMEL